MLFISKFNGIYIIYNINTPKTKTYFLSAWNLLKPIHCRKMNLFQKMKNSSMTNSCSRNTIIYKINISDFQGNMKLDLKYAYFKNTKHCQVGFLLKNISELLLVLETLIFFSENIENRSKKAFIKQICYNSGLRKFVFPVCAFGEVM